MSHTPGPWAWKIEGFAGYKLIAKDGTHVADDGSADGEYGGWMNDPNEPNARLIAAAPELLEALEKIVAIEHYRHGYHPAWTDQARAVIAKARGEK